jgi:uncharacterized radical SAM superfamily protein
MTDLRKELSEFSNDMKKLAEGVKAKVAVMKSTILQEDKLQKLFDSVSNTISLVEVVNNKVVRRLYLKVQEANLLGCWVIDNPFIVSMLGSSERAPYVSPLVTIHL